MKQVLNSIHQEASETQGLPDLSEFKQPHMGKAIWQVVNTVLPYLGLWGVMIVLKIYDISYWIILLLSIVAAAFLVRIFILFHDCCHQSFFSSRKANVILGHFLGMLVLTSYGKWRYQHLKHHGTSGNLDRRGTGDIWTMTVEEYKTSSKFEKLVYRIYRNPLIMLVIGPIQYFVVLQRIWGRNASPQQIVSVILTNLVLVAIICFSFFSVGFGTYLSIQLPVIMIGGAMGIWLFYVQHQFQGVYWARNEEWSNRRAALEGSSFYKLPKLLQWISGNIGFHHIHHLKPTIPNYHLQKCSNRLPQLMPNNIITLRKSLSSLFLNLWHEENSMMISFRKVKTDCPKPF